MIDFSIEILKSRRCRNAYFKPIKKEYQSKNSSENLEAEIETGAIE